MWYYIVGALVVLILLFCYNEIAKDKAVYVLMLFLVQSFLIKNIVYTKRPMYIQMKALENIDIIPILFRPLSKLYIEVRGMDLATGVIAAIVEKTENDENIELIK